MTNPTSLSFSIDTGLATLCLSRPDHGNALNTTLLEEIREVLKRMSIQPVRALLISGAGEDFCVGEDFSELSALEGTDPASLVDRELNPTLRAILSLEVPVVVAVQGRAAGAGMSLALAGDIVFAAPSARFIPDFQHLALGPSGGYSWLLPRQIGQARATAMTLLGHELKAPQALEWGLVWACVEEEQLLDAATQAAQQLATGPTRALALTKRTLNASASHKLDDQMDIERDARRQAGRSKDFREALEAYQAGRSPDFQGH